MNKIFLHIDANCFFASCEEILNPHLKNKSFVVANNNSHAIISCPNKQARTFGIKAAMNIDEAKKKCHNLIIVNPHYDWYAKKSYELFKTIKEFCNTDIEVMSIDECFVDISFILNNFHNNVEILAHELIKYIKQQTSLSVSIGAGNNKFLAKMASDTKPINQFSHIYIDEIPKKLWNTNIDKIFMVGKKTYEILKKLKINNVYDFINFSDQSLLNKLLKKRYWYLINAFKGISNDEINNNDLEKSINQSTTLNEFSDNYDFLINNLMWLKEELCQILKYRKIKTNHLTLIIKFLDKDNKLIQKTKAKRLTSYTNDEQIIWTNIKKVFDDFWKNNKLKLIGLSADNLMNEADLEQQNRLFKV